jgi:alkanesulfonate monooxygenase SsuD/methylene tetrahydromethanopterin reductase-like flavin-dependent oxidoreductase (luciferase family)
VGWTAAGPGSTVTLGASSASFDIGPDDVWPSLLGSPREVAEALIPYRNAGFRHVVVAFQPPFDGETIARLDEVRRQLEALTANG